MSYPSDIPVVIIGGGPTGLTTALLLAEYGVRSVILERAATPLDIPRAIVLDDEGLRTLQVFGADRAYLGMTVETLINTYGHHHPDHQEQAVSAVSRRRRGKDGERNTGTDS